MLETFFHTQFGSILGLVLGVLLISHILLQHRNPSGTIAWLLIIILVPYLGVPLYLAFGGRKMQRTAQRKTRLNLHTDCAVPLNEDAAALDRLLRTYDIPGAEGGNRIRFCTNGESIYRCLCDLIEEARESIYITTYIFQPDAVGRDIRDRLIRKAAQGVEVKVLMDGVGSLHAPKWFFRKLLKAGGQIATFIPVLHRPFRGRTNLRNHRKIIVIDHHRVMAGGTNIGSEYLGPTPSERRWKDLAFVLEGPCTRHYWEVFWADWEFAAGSGPATDFVPEPRDKGHDVVQIVPSGPDVQNDALYDALLSAIYAAERRIWIVTPYFVPDESLIQALMLASRRGVDVHVVMPQRSNHPLADLVRGYYLRQMQATGVTIHLYQRGMLHAKVIVTDDCAMVGSANIDIRSLFLNYEISMLCYTHDLIDQVTQYIDSILPDCRTGIGPAGTVRNLCESTVGILAPLL